MPRYHVNDLYHHPDDQHVVLSPIDHNLDHLNDVTYVHVLTDDERAALVERPAWHEHDDFNTGWHNHHGAAISHYHDQFDRSVDYGPDYFYPPLDDADPARDVPAGHDAPDDTTG